VGKKVVSLLPEGAQILDVGCGMGREAFALTDMGFSVVGIDISEAAVEQVSKLALQKASISRFFITMGITCRFKTKPLTW
jgi:2-polyprenyl-3-methyl-5-hydroxy-6-metoxy-1,4-benzoquinol methylase